MSSPAISPSFLSAANFLGLNHPHYGIGNVPCPWSIGSSWFPALPTSASCYLPPVKSTTTFPEYQRLSRSVQTEIDALGNWSNNAFDDYYNFVARDLMALGHRPMNIMEYYAFANPIRVDPRDGSRLLCLCFDLTGFRPEEVHITFNKVERAIIVEAGHEFKGAEAKGQHQHQVMRKYYRKFVLPEGIDYSNVALKSNMRLDSSIVCVDAVLPQVADPETMLKTSASNLAAATANYMPVPIKTTVA